MLQLNPPIPLMTPKGAGLAHFLLDYGPEFDLYWAVFLDGNGECWTFSNRDIRACKNITLGRVDVSIPKTSDTACETMSAAARSRQHVPGFGNGGLHGASDQKVESCEDA